MEELLGCWWEAQRADKVALYLSQIRDTVEVEFFEHITAVLNEIEKASRLLRDLYDLTQIYRSRVPMIVNDLNIILPSLLKTLQQMMIYVDNEGISARSQWTLMHERMGGQGGMSLAARFVMFSDFLVQLVRLLSRSSYDPTTLASLRRKIMRLRTLQGISAAPGQALLLHQAPLSPTRADLEVALYRPSIPIENLTQQMRIHWAQKLFDEKPRSSTSLRHRRESRCFGPPMVDVKLDIRPGSNVLFKLPFDKNHLSVTLLHQPESPDLTRLLCRWMDRYFNPLSSCYGVHELCVSRKGSALQFRRWSSHRMHPKIWLALFFKTWEKMVLFHCAFGALKSRCSLTLNIMPDDVVLAGENKLFSGKIIDDRFEHTLSVLQDEKCAGIRLHAAVRHGELRSCPVWTAFVTYQSANPSWLERKSRHRIWLKDLYPYVFCENYKKHHQMKKQGEFELYFANPNAADAFQDIFSEASEPGEATPAIEMSGANGPGSSEGSGES